MPEILTGCQVGDGSNAAHCYCGGNLCCYCRLPLEQAREQQQAPTLTTTAAQYRTRYTSQRYTNSNWFIDPPTATTTASWGIDSSALSYANTVSWTPIADGLAASDAILENLIFEEPISDDGSEEVKD